MYQGPPPEIWLITGAPGAGTTAVARALAARFERAAHVEGDRLARQIVARRVLPGEEPEEESDRQVELAIRNQCLLARSYAEAGFTPVIDYAIPTEHHLEAYRNYLMGGVLRLVVLAPSLVGAQRAALEDERAAARRRHLDAEIRREFTGLGLWLDTDLDVDETVDAILARRREALLR